MRKELPCLRIRRRALLAAVLAVTGSLAILPGSACAENLFDFFFGGFKQQQQTPQAGFFADPMNPNPQDAPPQQRMAVAGSGPAFCVRSCDGRYFPLMRGAASPVQMCQAFCPASPTKVFYGSSIDGAYATNGERYADSENAFAYRKALRADCTCNGRDPAGLAPVDLALDSSLRPGDVIATTDGLVAYSGTRTDSQAAEFTPVASYPGLTAAVRARLGEMKVAPASAELGDASITSSITPLPPKPGPRAKRADLN